MLSTDVEAHSARAALDHGAALVVTRFGEPRLSRAPRLSQDAPDVVATGITLWSATDTGLAAPWDGEVSADDAGRVTLRGNDLELTLAGVTRVRRRARQRRRSRWPARARSLRSA